MYPWPQRGQEAIGPHMQSYRSAGEKEALHFIKKETEVIEWPRGKEEMLHGDAFRLMGIGGKLCRICTKESIDWIKTFSRYLSAIRTINLILFTPNVYFGELFRFLINDACI
ncbi:hypothetical protein AVEN_247963-1 [Araneus ventricosus]|uniref:Uncharacterized protein n=1 Tax=Araneus ventricosus TaxID=182803 RepID=A0A4Y2CJI3_ARAVE|nr:hypothetical protein AVEN_247963-1 [Araneus ventricosus]